jgi:RND family efflux transporter MFP subunit
MNKLLKKFLLIGIPVIIGIVIAIVIISAPRKKAEGDTAVATTPRVLSAPVITIHKQNTAMTQDIPGSVVAIQHAELSAKVMSKISAVYVKEGDHVVKGQLLAKLEANDLNANVQQADAGLQNAQASYQQAKTGYSMQKTQSAVMIQQAQSSLEQAKAQLAKVKQGPRPEQILQFEQAENRAKAGYEQAAANLSMVKEGARSQHKLQADQGILIAQQRISQAESGLSSAKSNLISVQSDYNRMSTLYSQDIIPKQRLEHAANQLEAAQQSVKQAESAVSQAKSGLEIAKSQSSLVYEGARSQEVIAADKQMDQAKSGWEQAKQETIMAKKGSRWEDVETAEQAVRQAEAALRSANAAQAKDSVSEKDIVKANAGIAQAKAMVSSAKTMVSYTSIYAPFSGVITGRMADPGNMAMPQMPIIAMDDNSLYQLVSQVPEQQAGKLTRGSRVMVLIDSVQKSLPATITDIVPGADPISRTLKVKANLPPAVGIQSGLFGRISLSTGSESIISIPSSAIVDRNGLTGVYIIDETNTAQFAIITVGKKLNDRVEVLSGLQDGQRIIASKVDGITAGCTISAEGE